MAHFWWGQKREKNKSHWVSSNNLCKTKSEWDMGFKDLSTFNMAFLAKHSWRIMNDTSFLLHQIFKATYFSTTSFMKAKLGAMPSFTWKGIWEARKLLVEGCRWQIGDGKSINLWTNYWLPGYKSLSLANPTHDQESETKVESLFDSILPY